MKVITPLQHGRLIFIVCGTTLDNGFPVCSSAHQQTPESHWRDSQSPVEVQWIVTSPLKSRSFLKLSTLRAQPTILNKIDYRYNLKNQ